METSRVVIGWADRTVADGTLISVEQLVFGTDALVRARKHLAIEIGGTRARSAACSLRRRLTRLAAEAAREDAVLHVYGTNQTDGPSSIWEYGTLSVMVRAVCDHRIVWSMTVSSGQTAYSLPRWPVARTIMRPRTPVRLVVERARAAWERQIDRERRVWGVAA